MQEYVKTFLQQHACLDEQTTVWGKSTLRAGSYLCQEMPALELITSARCVLLRADSEQKIREVLIVHEPDGMHLLPGGQREPHETLLQTVQREVMEETGWTLMNAQLLGFLHFYHLTPRPENYRYAYPHFFQAVFCAQAQSFEPAGMFAAEVLANEHVLATEFLPVDKLGTLPLSTSNHLFLQAALNNGVSSES